MYVPSRDEPLSRALQAADRVLHLVEPVAEPKVPVSANNHSGEYLLYLDLISEGHGVAAEFDDDAYVVVGREPRPQHDPRPGYPC